MPEKLSEYKFSFPISIRFSDIDAVGHVNNATYLTYFEDTRLSYWKHAIGWDFNKCGIVVGRSEVNYLKQVTLFDKITCYVRVVRIGNSSFDMAHVLVKETATGQEICTTGKTVCVCYDYAAKRSVPIPEEERNRMIEYDEPRLILNTN